MQLNHRFRVYAQVATLLAMVSLVACEARWYSSHLADGASERVQVGMSLREVEHLLDDAWLHMECRSSHLFFYGSRDIDKTAAVVVVIEGPPDQQTVKFVGQATNYQSNRLVVVYRCCLKRSGFEVAGCES